MNSILSWNISGGCDRERAREIRNFISEGPYKPDIIGFIETRSKNVTVDLSHFGYKLIKCLSVVGMSGGLELWAKEKNGGE